MPPDTVSLTTMFCVPAPCPFVKIKVVVPAPLFRKIVFTTPPTVAPFNCKMPALEPLLPTSRFKLSRAAVTSMAPIGANPPAAVKLMPTPVVPPARRGAELHVLRFRWSAHCSDSNSTGRASSRWCWRSSIASARGIPSPRPPDRAASTMPIKCLAAESAMVLWPEQSGLQK